jgi:hypothetical protein
MKKIIEKTLVKFLSFIKVRLENENPRGDNNVYKIIWDRAIRNSADYVEKHLDNTLLFPIRENLWDYALSKTNKNGIFIEFGVFNGYSINYFGSKLKKDIKLFGFDSFEGLKEDWWGFDAPAGHFDVGGNLPKVLPQVTLVKGWFDVTLPEFLKNNNENFSFIHLDADTYESTILVLDLISSRIVTGTIIVFDEYFGYPNWEKGEYLAWKKYCEGHQIKYKYIGFSTFQAAVQIL